MSGIERGPRVEQGRETAEEKEKYNEIRDVLNEFGEIKWKEVERAELSPEKQAIDAKFASCERRYGNKEFHRIKSEIYDEALDKSNSPEYVGLLHDKLFFGLQEINNEVSYQIKKGGLSDKEVEKLRSESYEQARSLIKEVAETVGKEKAQLVLDKFHEVIESSRDYLF